MQAGGGFIIMHMHGSNHALIFDMTGKVRYKQENNNQRNGEDQCYLLVKFLQEKLKQNERLFPICNKTNKIKKR